MTPGGAGTVLIVLVGVALSACGGAGGSATPTPPPGIACPDDIAERTASLVAPPNGATGVSPTIGSITATSSTGLAGAQLALVPAAGAPVLGGIFAAASSSTVTASVPVLSAHTTYTVSASAAIPESDGCTQGVAWTIGSFTTQ
jgi:hypothetical protein